MFRLLYIPHNVWNTALDFPDVHSGQHTDHGSQVMASRSLLYYLLTINLTQVTTSLSLTFFISVIDKIKTFSASITVLKKWGIVPGWRCGQRTGVMMGLQDPLLLSTPAALLLSTLYIGIPYKILFKETIVMLRNNIWKTLLCENVLAKLRRSNKLLLQYWGEVIYIKERYASQVYTQWLFNACIHRCIHHPGKGSKHFLHPEAFCFPLFTE